MKKKKKKGNIQSCDISGSIYGKKGEKRRTSHSRKNVRKKDLADVYDKFFKDQAAALYKAISKS